MDTTIIKPLVSIIIITRNRARFIPETLGGIISQTYTNWEIIIVDDGSTDDTEQVVYTWADTHNITPRLHFIKNNQSVGISKARNQAYNASSGAYIAVCDSDDVWADRSKLTAQIDFLEQHPTYAVIGTDVTTIDEVGKKIGTIHYPSTTDALKKKLLEQNVFCHSSVVMRKQALQKIGRAALYDESLTIWEDYELLLHIGSLGFDLANINSPMTSYRVHSSGISRSAGVYGAYLHARLAWSYRRYYPHSFKAFIKNSLRILVRACGF